MCVSVPGRHRGGEAEGERLHGVPGGWAGQLQGPGGHLEDPAGGHPARVSPQLAVSIVLLCQGISLAATLGRYVKRVHALHILFEGFPNSGILKAERIK